MNGGYIMIKASDTNIYLEASKALTIGKPILFYENDTTCYYIDTITLDGTNIVLTKGGKTITIADDNTITTSGDIQVHLYRYWIYDSDVESELLLPIKIDEITIDASATELTDNQKENLNKLMNAMPFASYSQSLASRDTGWIPLSITFDTSTISFTINFTALDANNGLDELNASYTFNIADGKIDSIDSISDTTFGDAFNLRFTEQLF